MKYTMPFEKLIQYKSFSIHIDVHKWLDHSEEQFDNINKISTEQGIKMYNEMQKYVEYINQRHRSGALEGIMNDIDLKQNNLTKPM